MNSKKVCCICVLFSLLAGCASESPIDEKKKKAQVTQSNINKNIQVAPDDRRRYRHHLIGLRVNLHESLAAPAISILNIGKDISRCTVCRITMKSTPPSSWR